MKGFQGKLFKASLDNVVKMKKTLSYLSEIGHTDTNLAIWKEFSDKALAGMKSLGRVNCFRNAARKCGADCVAFDLEKVVLDLNAKELKKLGISFFQEDGQACGYVAVCRAGGFNLGPAIDPGTCALD